ncbi:udp-glucose 4-epimerase [Phaffia rhodozyma]|uniref:UDP-glucose 4-epimerase n=1 Tax=Phaffia rhodozyma TaxID=264483 RepID=A0A0F7SJH6_PHARH|nr:udp-glucose 4-epimerase [Phaffia rhodozyma]
MSAPNVSPKKRVLVTGGAGYIGSHAVLELVLTQRYQPVVIDNGHNSKSEAIKRIEQIAKQQLGDANVEPIDTFNLDLTSQDAVDSVFKAYEGKGGIWGVVHIAAWKAVGESAEKPLKYYQNNVSATINLLDSMQRFNVKHIVYSSSATVYGTPELIPIPESSPIKPESVYGRTKAVCEAVLRDLVRGDPELKAISLRYFNPAGAHPSGLIGEDPRGKPLNLIPLLAAMAVGRYVEGGLKVFGDDYPTVDGTCVRDYLHVVDLAKGHVLACDALESPTLFKTPDLSATASSPANRPAPTLASLPTSDDFAQGINFRAFNLGKGKAFSVLQIIKAMEKAFGTTFPYEVVGRREGDVPDLTADPSLAEKELGFLATRGLEEACRDLEKWQTGNPNGYDSL